jgi:hypothetical protein
MFEEDLKIILNFKINFDHTITLKDRKIFNQILSKYFISIGNCHCLIQKQKYMLNLFKLLDTKFGRIAMHKDVRFLNTLEIKTKDLYQRTTLPELTNFLEDFIKVFD